MGCRVLEIDPRCRVIRGAGRPGATTMAGLTMESGVVLLVGHHARAGSFPGIMAHTISYGWFKLVRLHGEPIGEPVARYGPFVMNSQKEIMEAIRDYQMGKLGTLEENFG